VISVQCCCLAKYHFKFIWEFINSLIHLFPFVEVLLQIYSSLSRSVKSPTWGAGPRFEPKTALQQSDALLIELRRNLQIHFGVHEGEKLFSYSHCTRSFPLLGQLREHLLRHSKERSFNCSYCLMVLTNLGSLQLHLRILTGEKLHCCPQGTFSFSALGNPYRHFRVPTGDLATRFFVFNFFHIWDPPKPLSWYPKAFFVLFRICEDIRVRKFEKSTPRYRW